jgi:hypothetical protein
VCRILDWFFLDGPCVLFQIGLALFKISENEVLNTKDEGSTILAAMQQRTLEDPDLLFKVLSSCVVSCVSCRACRATNAHGRCVRCVSHRWR